MGIGRNLSSFVRRTRNGRRSRMSSRFVGPPRPTNARGKRKLRTKTFTKTRTKLNQIGKANALQTGSISTLSIGRNRLNKFQYNQFKNKLPFKFTTSEVGTFTAAIGLQNIDLVSSMYTVYFTNLLYGFLKNQSADSTTKAFNQTQAIMSHAIVPWVTSSETMLTNASNSPAKLTLYDVELRKTICNTYKADPIENITTSAPYEGDNTTDAYKYLGWTPFASSSFCDDYIVKKVTHVDLAEGQMHRHTVVNKNKCKFKIGQAINDAPNGDDYTGLIDGLTSYTIAFVHGTPCASVTNPTAEISTTNIKINWVTKYNYDVRIPDTNDKFVQKTSNGIPLSLTGGGTVMGMYTGDEEVLDTV